MQIRILPDPASLAGAAADEVASWLEADDRRTIGLAGGTTPRQAYQLLRRSAVVWEGVEAWMTDERFVPIQDPASNAGMASDTLFDHVPAVLHSPVIGDDPHAAAAEYEATVTRLLGADEEDRPVPDLVLLGLGSDGHTASLFPNTYALDLDERDYVANWVPSQAAWRLTATAGLLGRARRMLFIVSGEDKAAPVADILERGIAHPAAEVARAAKDVVWLLDREAAADLG